MKIAPIHAELERRGIDRILHTGQHYDENMSKVSLMIWECHSQTFT